MSFYAHVLECEELARKHGDAFQTAVNHAKALKAASHAAHDLKQAAELELVKAGMDSRLDRLAEVCMQREAELAACKTDMIEAFGHFF